MRTAFIDTLVEAAHADERIWLLCGDLGYSVVEKFADAFPKRFINAGVAEQNMMGVAAGLAATGRTVVTYSIANFATLRCYEQIRNDICLHNANVKIVAVGGGLVYGVHGYTHHAVEDIAAMRALPHLSVIAPADPVEAKLATQCMLSDPGPFYLRLGKAGEPVLHHQLPRMEAGHIIPVLDGGDIMLVSTGGMLATALESAQRLRAHGIMAGVASSPFMKPFDSMWVQQNAARMGYIATLEEHSPHGGLADAVGAALAGMDGARARLLPFTIPEGMLHGIAGTQQELLTRAGLSAESVAQRIAVAMGKKPE